MRMIEEANPDYESCADCIHSDDSEEICALRRCIHAVSRLKECYVPKSPTIEPEHTGNWIPCSERFPELDVYVIATTQWYEITMACRIGDGEWFIHEDNANAYDDDILAWMPLPEPYRP